MPRTWRRTSAYTDGEICMSILNLREIISRWSYCGLYGSRNSELHLIEISGVLWKTDAIAEELERSINMCSPGSCNWYSPPCIPRISPGMSRGWRVAVSYSIWINEPSCRWVYCVHSPTSSPSGKWGWRFARYRCLPGMASQVQRSFRESAGLGCFTTS